MSNEHNNAHAVPQGEPIAYLWQCRKKPVLRAVRFNKRDLALESMGYKPSPLYATPATAPAITYDQWQQHEYTKVLQDRIKELSEKLAIYTQAPAQRKPND